MGRPKNFNREGVLEKALPVFCRRGFADASLHQLEMATGVNKSGLYSEFKDKEDLFPFWPFAGDGPCLPCRFILLGPARELIACGERL
jgi:hypothetical protein